MTNLKMESVLDYVIKNAIHKNPKSVLDTIDSYAMNGSLERKRFLMNVGPEKGAILKDCIETHKSKKNIRTWFICWILSNFNCNDYW
jgi:hypothetical protein